MAANNFSRLLLENGRLGLEPFLRGGWQAFGWVAGETLINVSAILGTLMLAGRFTAIGSWSRPELYFLLGFVLLARGIANVFSGRNVLMISRRIGRGQLDHSLLQPVPLWKALAAEGFSPFDLLVTLVLGVGVVVWSAMRLSTTHHVLWFGEFLLNLGASVAVIIAYQYLWGALAFWSPFGAEEVNTSSAAVVGQLSAYPLDGVPRLFSGLLITVVPVGLIGWLPARNLLHGSSGPLSHPLTVPLFAVVLVMLTGLVFRLGLKRYERYGSGRYSDFGHRR
jgi:ABC-2 type transport system permease protein